MRRHLPLLALARPLAVLAVGVVLALLAGCRSPRLGGEPTAAPLAVPTPTPAPVPTPAPAPAPVAASLRVEYYQISEG
ncbi:MAG: hypothetical protein ACKOSS_07630 [Planctomycetia bacterium]